MSPRIPVPPGLRRGSEGVGSRWIAKAWIAVIPELSPALLLAFSPRGTRWPSAKAQRHDLAGARRRASRVRHEVPVQFSHVTIPVDTS